MSRDRPTDEPPPLRNKRSRRLQVVVVPHRRLQVATVTHCLRPKTGERIGIQPCEIFCDDVAPCSFCDSGVRFAHVHSGQPRGHPHFERGEILEVVIITDKGTGRSNGGGFEAEAAIRACLSPYPMISGRRATATSHASGPEGVRVERSRWLPFKHQQIGNFKP
ncbi:uncharacterized protein LOC119271629 isoform X2 [Triticum dicoccoides]|uniref:uncharacterized protein LOC119271629 isoform X2 n=1 Tax=Triticum dicoccoides TaxID=85692 RepID=UPI001890134D|nr:uncharacterized protein LOC119271629 isoform X2 [Triticum dicoccoides]